SGSVTDARVRSSTASKRKQTGRDRLGRCGGEDFWPDRHFLASARYQSCVIGHLPSTDGSSPSDYTYCKKVPGRPIHCQNPKSSHPATKKSSRTLPQTLTPLGVPRTGLEPAPPCED